MTHTREIDAALRTLDAADRDVPVDDASVLDRLDAIVATDPAGSGAADLPAGLPDARRRPGRARTVRRVGWAAAVVAAATAALLVVPTMIGDSGRAFAGWTPQPEAMSAAEQGRAVAECRYMLMPQQGPANAGEPADAAARMSAATAVTTERRGPWTTVLLTDAAGLWGYCVTGPDGGAAGLNWETEYTAPLPHDVTLVTTGYGYFIDSEYSMMAGFAGGDVTGLVFDSHENGAVTATVMNGYFVLWMPGDEWKFPAVDTTVTVTLADGTSHPQVLTS